MKSLEQLAAELPCPTCRQQFPGYRALYEHWKATGHVEVKVSDEEMQAALKVLEEG